ncbi:MAG TPA: trypsin-like peptidase domain-containing protein [Patescibacteria group bacterium]|nr:trypsin-like peptidase domain-containing protein [Patescibacteria group bacterium]
MKKTIVALILFSAFLLAGGVATGIWVSRVVPLPSSLENKLQIVQKLTNEESAVTDVVEKAGPAVVTVSIEANVSTFDPFSFDPFNPFGSNDTQKEEQDIGTGFIVDKSGLIITNRHVVSRKDATYYVFTKDGEKYKVDKVYKDPSPSRDLAILKISAKKDLPTVALGDSSTLKVGQLAIAIGNALGELRDTVTVGVISGLGRGIEAQDPSTGVAERLDDVIQTDAAINPGNSGGPLLNSAAEVVGVNVATSVGSENIGFAIPINTVKEIMKEFQETGTLTRPYLGVRYQQLTLQQAVAYEFPEGAFLHDVISDSPAEKAGLKQGDVVTEIDGKKLTEEQSISQIVEGKKVGDTITLSVFRKGEGTKSYKIQLEAMPTD